MSGQSSMLNWPEWADRTDPDDRDSGSQFSTKYQRTKRQLGSEMERMGVDSWTLDTVTGSGTDPGVVLRWRQNNQPRVVSCDAYSSKKANLRAIFLWVKETRKSGDRPVKTGRDQFAAAALPGVDQEATPMGAGDERDPHEVLEAAPDASDDVVRVAAREKKRQHSPDSGVDPDKEEFIAVNKAEDAMLDGE